MASIRFLAVNRLLTPSVSCRQLHVQPNRGEGYRKSRSSVNDHPFERLYSWKTLEQFVGRLYDGIVYEDGDIVAIDKPWGVGIHKPHPTITRQNSYQMTEALKFGDPRFCVDDVLDILCEKLKTNRLTVRRSIDRFESGIILLSKNDTGDTVIERVANYHKPQGIPFAKFWCITKGYPVIPGNFISEKATMMKIDVDDMAEYKEPILVHKGAFKTKFLAEHRNDFVTGAVEMRVLETNKEFAVSLVEIATNQNKFSFVRCYAASKTSFIVGDTRFAKRIRHVLGKPITLKPQTVPEGNYEPLQFSVRRKLLVPSNAAVPLMIHLKSIIVPKLGARRKELLITTPNLPEHFEWTMHRLKLMNDNHSSQNVSENK